MTVAQNELEVSQHHVRASLRAACLLEATARKPGNVHPGASFVDLTYEHFRRAADSMPELALASQGVGRAIFDAIAATRDIAGSNANLGIVLLLAPLAAVPVETTLKNGIATVLARLTVEDAEWVYRAIRLARPGGLGEVPDQDVAEQPTETLLRVMSLAADRDRIAFQYAHRFVDVFDLGVSCLARCDDFESNWEGAIIGLQLELMSRIPDSLILRKCGQEVADEASHRARQVLEAGWPDSRGSADQLQEFDHWLRADGNRRNPGTTADLIAACLFAALRDRWIPFPEFVRGEF